MIEKTAEYDVMIIGGGPGGLSAGLWCAELGLHAILLEKEAEFGGALLRTFNVIRNHLGIEAANGRELRDIFLRQLENADILRHSNAEIVAADLGKKAVSLADGTKVSGGSIIIATGVRRRKLGVPGEEELNGRGILESGGKAKAEVAGKRIVIVGGGDAALENALILGRTAARVFVIHRRGEFSAREEFTEQARKSENIEFVFDSKVSAIVGNATVEAVEVQNISSGKVTRIATDNVLIRVGVEPNTELFRDQISMDAARYITIDNNCSTSLTGVFAIGDVANQLAPTVSAAVGMGAIAARAIHDADKT